PPNRRLDVSPTSFFRPPKEVAVIESRLHAEKQCRGRLRHTAHDGRTIWTERLRRVKAAEHGHYRSSRAFAPAGRGHARAYPENFNRVPSGAADRMSA